MFHAGLKFIFCRRWQVIYVSLSAHMLQYVTTRHYTIKLFVDKIIRITIIIQIITITIIINKKMKNIKSRFTYLYVCVVT